ncbi:MAG TPA: hypothetical protein V6C86_18150 [Oculatellaceae cyanobacterium]|jgi:hypothetical protein
MSHQQTHVEKHDHKPQREAPEVPHGIAETARHIWSADHAKNPTGNSERLDAASKRLGELGFPNMTVVGAPEKGTLRVKDSEGHFRDVSAHTVRGRDGKSKEEIEIKNAEPGHGESSTRPDLSKQFKGFDATKADHDRLAREAAAAAPKPAHELTPAEKAQQEKLNSKHSEEFDKAAKKNEQAAGVGSLPELHAKREAEQQAKKDKAAQEEAKKKDGHTLTPEEQAKQARQHEADKKASEQFDRAAHRHGAVNGDVGGLHDRKEKMKEAEHAQAGAKMTVAPGGWQTAEKSLKETMEKAGIQNPRPTAREIANHETQLAHDAGFTGKYAVLHWAKSLKKGDQVEHKIHE